LLARLQDGTLPQPGPRNPAEYPGSCWGRLCDVAVPQGTHNQLWRR